MHKLALSMVAALCCCTHVSASQSVLVINEHQSAVAHFGNDAAWYEHNIPFFEASDPLLQKIYYYRWQLFRAHQRDLGARGYISTEFLDDVAWQLEPWASLNDATVFHILEGRWLRDRRYTSDYINFMYQGGNDRHFSEAIADASYQNYLVNGDKALLLKQLPQMQTIYDAWQDHFDDKQGLYWVEPIADATEYTISSIDASGGKDGFFKGFAFRPTINSYMVANARAIANIADLAGNKRLAADYQQRAETLQATLNQSLWNSETQHFTDRYQQDNEFVHYGKFVRGPELEGYLPWTYKLAPDNAQYTSSWQQLLDPQQFAGRFGLRTVTPDYQYYMKQYRYFTPTGAPECQWNGPVWPYQTTQVLTAMANLLDDYQQHAGVTKHDYMRLLEQYAALHMMNGQPDLQEDYDPDNGKVIVGLDRSHHYFHSGFNDLIISGLVGIRPQPNNSVVVAPLVPNSGDGALDYFALQDVPYHGHQITITFDKTGQRYPEQGLTVYVDGKAAAHSKTIAPLKINIEQAPLVAVKAPINLAVQLDKQGFPKASAASNQDPIKLHQAIDGRVWFFPELANGWDARNPDTNSSRRTENWYQVDFGKNVSLSQAELSFFAKDRGFAAPRRYQLQAWVNQHWQTVAEHKSPYADGINHDHFATVTTNKLRAVFDIPVGKSMRLVELKAFQ
ncbi:glycogen debranching protein [Shewanella mangrovi]|uniref:Glycogen debranching protein n=1 Tax=Shewanella mangrovi TaxID=1515746 RepID=A0A094LNL1_9GAMM|nr:trehalase family glycosidase [Shewanella mangrovi]KFZ36718.1 glycogen debranching protein [Shewanella mangrovi]